MPTDIPDSFIVVSGEPELAHRLLLRWTDDVGGGGEASEHDLSPLWAAVEARLAPLRDRRRSSGKRPSLPVFADGEWVLKTLRARCPHDLSHEVTFVKLLPDRGAASSERRPPVQLPLHVLACEELGIPAEDWPQHQGLRVELCRESELAARLEAGQVDILVCPFPPLHPRIDWSRIWHPPRLAVSHFSTRRPWGPIGALLSLPSVNVAINDVLLNVIHDDPLHDAVRDIPDAQLVATPQSNQDLRLSATVEQVAEDALDLLIQAPASTYASRFGFDLSKQVKDVARIATATLRFDHETNGLAPLSISALSIDALRAAMAPLTEGLLDTSRGDEPAPAPRFVDLRLRRREPSPLLSANTSPGDVWVPPSVALRLGARYDLRVQIGGRVPGSLVPADAPSIDGTLPVPRDGETRELDVVVFDQGLTPQGPASRRIVLPSSGATAPLWFPLRPSRTGTSGARISLYWRNVLLQSFQLSATVAEEERFLARHEAPLQAKLDFSRTETFAELPADAPQPILSLGLNDDVGGGTHTLCLKGAGDPHGVRLLESDVSAAMMAFRDIVHRATEDEPGQQRYPLAFPDPERFRADLSKLARAGWNLFGKLYFNQPDEVSDLLSTIRYGQDQYLQVARLNPGLAFPWPAIYDWEPPREGREAPPVCLGRGPDGAVCAHGPDSNGPELCVRGFWGIRHRMEQLVGLSTPEVRLHDGRVLLAVDQTLSGAARVASSCGPGVASFIPDTRPALLEPLFAEAERPAVYVALGKHITRSQVAGPTDPTVPYLAIDRRVIEKEDLVRRSIKPPRWARERPLVLLMSCNSALAGDLVVDWVRPLLKKGAAGVVATEGLVYPELAVEATTVLLECLYRKDRPCDLAEAMRELQMHLLEQSVPLGFVFTAIGDAGLRL